MESSNGTAIINISEDPIFSIIIPTYNRPLLLARAIKSVTNQTYSNYEIIVVDDGSSDKSVVRRAVSNHSNIKYIDELSNNGASKARNLGIKHSRGCYITFLDDDDELNPNFLEETYKVLSKARAEIGLVWSSAKIVNYSGSVSDEKYDHKEFPINFTNKAELFTTFLSIGIGYGITIKRECLNIIGLFNEELKIVEDADFFIRFLIAGYVPKAINTTSVIIHNHTGDRLSNTKLNEIRVKECKALLTNHNYFFYLFPELRQQLINYIKYLEESYVLYTKAGSC